MGWENRETFRSVALPRSSFSDHSVYLISSENLSQLMDNDKFWNQVLLMFHNTWVAKQVILTRFPEPLPAASPQNLFLFSPISLSSWRAPLLITQMFHQLCFLPSLRAADSTSRGFGTERFGSGGGGLLAAHRVEQAHGQGAGLWGETAGAGGVWHFTDVPFLATFVFGFLLPCFQVNR